MARVIGANVGDGSSLLFKWGGPVPAGLDARIENSKVPWPSALPRFDVSEVIAAAGFLIESPGRTWVPDVMGYNRGPYIVCAAIRDWMEKHDDRHTFYPVPVRSAQPIKGTTEHGLYYVMGDIPKIGPLDVQRTAWAGGMYGVPDGRTMASHPDAPCVVFKDKIKGHHFWRTTEPQGLKYMCSELFWHFYIERKFRGFSCDKKCLEI